MLFDLHLLQKRLYIIHVDKELTKRTITEEEVVMHVLHVVEVANFVLSDESVQYIWRERLPLSV